MFQEQDLVDSTMLSQNNISTFLNVGSHALSCSYSEGWHKRDPDIIRVSMNQRERHLQAVDSIIISETLYLST